MTSYIFRLWRLAHLQFAFLIQVEDAFFEVVHLAEDQGFIEDRVVAPQQWHGLALQNLFPLQHICKKAKLVYTCNVIQKICRQTVFLELDKHTGISVYDTFEKQLVWLTLTWGSCSCAQSCSRSSSSVSYTPWGERGSTLIMCSRKAFNSRGLLAKIGMNSSELALNQNKHRHCFMSTINTYGLLEQRFSNVPVNWRKLDHIQTVNGVRL